MTAAAIDALRNEQSRALTLFDSLTPEEWRAASGCTGWRVQDVVQHMASTFHTIADPASIEGGTSADAEENAEVPVRARREWAAADVMTEYAEWSQRGIDALAAMQGPPLGDTVIPLGNLGNHPMHILANAIVFDHYCHLRHDLGAIVERAAALPHDTAALEATVEWMLAGLPQMCAETLATCDTAVNLRFTDLDGAVFALRPGPDGWTVTPGSDVASDAAFETVSTTAHDFVNWGTKRADWRTCGVTASNSAAARTLDAINVI